MFFLDDGSIMEEKEHLRKEEEEENPDGILIFRNERF